MDTLQKLRGKADAWERIGESHPSFRDAELVGILRAAADELARLREALEPFDRADQSDWDRLLHTLGWSGHDRFWRSVLEDYRRARAALEPNG